MQPSIIGWHLGDDDFLCDFISGACWEVSVMGAEVYKGGCDRRDNSWLRVGEEYG